MSLRTEQERFAVALATLILEADKLGIKMSIGDVFRDPRLHGQVGEAKGYGHSRSCHKLKLAADLNLINPKDHETLHDIWDTLGGSPRIPNDMNHYSFEWQGMR
jgi:hypothetical protein